MAYTLRQEIINALKIIVVGALITYGVSYLHAAWSGPTKPPPPDPTSVNAPAPINVSVTAQDKLGALGVSALAILGDGTVQGNFGAGVATPRSTAPNSVTTGNMEANDIFVRSISKWISTAFAQGGGGGTSGLIPNPYTLVLYGQQSVGTHSVVFDSYHELSLWGQGTSREQVKLVAARNFPSRTAVSGVSMTDAVVLASQNSPFEVDIGWGTAANTKPIVDLYEVRSYSCSGSCPGGVDGFYADIAWKGLFANSCTASGNWSGTKPTQGTASIGPLPTTWSPGTQNFGLTCTNGNGSATDSLQYSNVPLTATLTAGGSVESATVVDTGSGGTVELAWNVTGNLGGASCTARGNLVKLDGTENSNGALG
ncbi:MAG: hypothetical protein G01um101472_309 [Parcubacteria group bacterium Gr01-1014_72]|nr:MAG: hypothetical protein G01um101472_309 [Parcubacteria group bacterium Gr01-1014_72]